jgi:hypothetical protein
MEPGNLLKLHGDIFGEDGDYICFASGYALTIKYHCLPITNNRPHRPKRGRVGEYYEIYYDGHLGFCLPSVVVEVIQ